jgi:hypothetical protein
MIKYGRLTIIKEIKERQGGHIVYNCLCDCGKSINTPINHDNSSTKEVNGNGN